jgi:hypothetical protein
LVRDATNNMSDLISMKINNLYTQTHAQADRQGIWFSKFSLFGYGFVPLVQGSTTWPITYWTRVKFVRCKVPISFLHGGDPIRNDSWK